MKKVVLCRKYQTIDLLIITWPDIKLTVLSPASPNVTGKCWLRNWTWFSVKMQRRKYIWQVNLPDRGARDIGPVLESIDLAENVDFKKLKKNVSGAWWINCILSLKINSLIVCTCRSKRSLNRFPVINYKWNGFQLARAKRAGMRTAVSFSIFYWSIPLNYSEDNNYKPLRQ